tara:strand:+ start:183 stop:428 length:246 start_codon:yes stop_codon:yes gene_type:complete
MTIKELKEKIEALETALRFPALPNDNATLQGVLKDILLGLQGDLIKKLDVRPVSNAQNLPWDWDNRDSMTDEEHEKALNNM